MTKSLIFLLVSVCLAKLTYSQNLVTNPDLENYAVCPDGPAPSSSQFPTGWNNTADFVNTPDYFNTCGYTDSNTRGNQTSRSGSGHVGFGAYSSGQAVGGTRYLSEYFYQALNTPLNAGTEYYIEFWVSLADFTSYSLKHLGMYLTNDPDELVFVDDIYFEGLYNLDPQIPNTYPASNFYTNTSGWTKISGFFTPSISGVRHIVIGNFDGGILNGNPSLQANPGDILGAGGSYYYVDDVTIGLASSCPADMASEIPYRAFTNPASTICKNSVNNTYTAPRTPGATSYTWTSKSPYLSIDGMSSTTTPTPSVKIIASQAGTLRMDLVANTACGPTHPVNPIYVPVDPCPGGPFFISPNPANDLITVALMEEVKGSLATNTASSASKSNHETFTVELYDKNQKMLARSHSKAEKVRLNVRNLPNNTYYIHIRYKNEIQRHQIMVE